MTYEIALAGNPNVGKSTVFNALTGLKQHTGNWTGKTVELCTGIYKYHDCFFNVTDLPGTYSMKSYSKEESVSQSYLSEKNPDCVIIVADSNVLERNLSYILEVLELQSKAVLCLNMSDEAKRNGTVIDTEILSKELGIPVLKTCAVRKAGLEELKQTVQEMCERDADADIDNTQLLDNALLLSNRSREICKKCVRYSKSTKRSRLDKILTSKATGIPIMLALFALLFWITAIGANYPSEWLSALFGFIKEWLHDLSDLLQAPEFLRGILIDGVYTTLSWVVSVMLPPMAVFFPLFSIIEDSGYLPRIAFNLDKFFSCCGSNGKQSLSMAMGIGCNACGVTGCRIIENPRERLIAVLTNNFMPCNGRFPILIAMIMMFFAGSAFGIISSLETALILLLILVACVLITLGVSKLLSVTVLKGTQSGFALELPPYRKPQILKTIARSMLHRTLFVLGRAVIVAAPAGAVIWLTANIKIGDCSVLRYCTDFLDPFGRFIGLDGVILTAFILGFPANETVIPIIIMSYTASGVLTEYSGYPELLSLLSANGWTVTTAVCMTVMTVLHFPCSTTCLTIKKETGSLKWMLLSMAIPTVLGITVCAAIANIMRIF